MSDRKKLQQFAVENRAFGRRATVRHAWIVVGQRQRLSCCIRNLSVGGALLELAVPAWLPYNFDIEIEEPKMKVTCEVRHRGLHGVGVAFLSNARELMLLDECYEKPVPAPTTIIESHSLTNNRVNLPAALGLRANRAPA